MKKVCYTFISEGYDTLKEPKQPHSDWEYVCFTNDKHLKSDVWNVVQVHDDIPDKKLSRKYKILNPFPEFDISVYIDGTFEIVGDLNLFAHSNDYGLSLNKHPQRKCAYKEAEIIKLKSLDSAEIIDQQTSKYLNEGFPKEHGLYRCGIMVRSPKNDQVQEMMNIWWGEIEAGSWRDQLSFPYAAWKSGVKPHKILKGITPIYFKQHLHKPKPLGDFKLTPILFTEYDGTVINQRIREEVFPNDWVIVGREAIDHTETIRSNPNSHLIVSNEMLIFPKWLHNYIQMPAQHTEKGKRFDEYFKYIVEVYNGSILNV